MNRVQQYAVAVIVIVAGLLASYLGFVYTGGAVPWGERFAAAAEGGLAPGGGSLFQFGRGGLGGFVLAGPLQENVVFYVGIVLVLVVGSLLLYRYAEASSEPSIERGQNGNR